MLLKSIQARGSGQAESLSLETLKIGNPKSVLAGEHNVEVIIYEIEWLEPSESLAFWK